MINQLYVEKPQGSYYNLSLKFVIVARVKIVVSAKAFQPLEMIIRVGVENKSVAGHCEVVEARLLVRGVGITVLGEDDTPYKQLVFDVCSDPRLGVTVVSQVVPTECAIWGDLRLKPRQNHNHRYINENVYFLARFLI